METRKRNIVFHFENTAEAESTGWTHIPPHFQLLRLRLLPSLLPFLQPSILSPQQFPSSSFQPPLASAGKVRCECVLAGKIQNYIHTIIVDDLHNVGQTCFFFCSFWFSASASLFFRFPFPGGVEPEYRVADEEASGSFLSAAPGCDAEASEPSAYKRGSL